ncbi:MULTISPECIES: fumarate hydratase [unclassified Photobacterium]|uniref:fumarate hydratase n=1 Tax=unclassified Photobacterium TaxID=2628852 RepID=UPI001EDE3FBF|nr:MULTISPECIES: fumarate hydratase [unclassified Photobacterium]MCG3865827.1 fumarate hydratase [Photobacterium sp. Ph6]MCG3877302.1 fumarate hydratase [Photobacterium sp. Ph5]
MNQPADTVAKTEQNNSKNDMQQAQFNIARIFSIVLNVVLILAQIKLLKVNDVTIKTYGLFILCNVSILFSIFAPRLTSFKFKQILKYTYMPTIIAVFIFIGQVTN